MYYYHKVRRGPGTQTAPDTASAQHSFLHLQNLSPRLGLACLWLPWLWLTHGRVLLCGAALRRRAASPPSSSGLARCGCTVAADPLCPVCLGAGERPEHVRVPHEGY